MGINIFTDSPMTYSVSSFARFRRQIGNYGMLTLAILLMMLIRPFMEQGGDRGVAVDILFMMVFLAGVYAARKEKYHYWVAILLTSIGLAGRIHLHLTDYWLVPLLVQGSAMLFFLHALYNVMSFVWVQRHRVNHDVIFAAVSAYLLLGIVWAYLYEFHEMAYPGSFKGGHGPMEKDDFFYFSFVTLATVGYGDIVPLTRTGRSLAIVESLTGQLYLTILVARLIGAYVSQYRRQD